MKLLFVNPYFTPWAPGGAEHSLEEMCVRFVRQGWSVQVLAAAFDDRPLDEERNGFWIRWVRAPFRREAGQGIGVEWYFRTRHFWRAATDRFHRVERPDIIVANNAQVYGLTAFLARKHSLPSIAIVRDTQLLCESGACMDNHPSGAAAPCRGYLESAACFVRFHRLRGEGGWRSVPAWALSGLCAHARRLRMRRALRSFDRVVAISDALNGLVGRAIPGLSPRPVETIRNFTTQSSQMDEGAILWFLQERGLADGHYFMFAGRKTHGKGADLLVEAMALVREQIPDSQCLFLGRGHLPSAGGPGCVDCDSVPRSLLPGLLSRAVALVIPGRWQEGLHRTMIDAIWQGKPIVCSNVGAPPVDGVVHGGNGLVCAANDAQALARAMEDVWRWEPEQLENGRRVSAELFAARYGDDIILESWRALFGALCPRAG